MLISEIHTPINGGLDRACPTLEINCEEQDREHAVGYNEGPAKRVERTAQDSPQTDDCGQGE